MWPNPQFPADLATFTEEILHGKLHILCSATLEGWKAEPIMELVCGEFGTPAFVIEHLNNKNIAPEA